MFGANVTFAHKWVLLLLLLLPMLIAWYYLLGKKRNEKVLYSQTSILPRKKSIREVLADVPFFFRIIALGFIIIALARPQSLLSGEEIYSEGIDIALVLDLSGSMLAEDFSPNRLEAAKTITDNFIQARKTDRIGLVVFSRDAFTQCPLTVDYAVLRNLLKEIKNGMLEDGTAIGNAITNGVNRLKDSKSQSKVMILLTDGINNAGEVDPLTASDIAKKFGVRIYTIGVGTYGEAQIPVQTPRGLRYQMQKVEIDENILTQIADETGGKYFRATDNAKLENIYKEIDKMEKSRIEVTAYQNKSERFYIWVIAALIALFFEFVLSRTILRRLP